MTKWVLLEDFCIQTGHSYSRLWKLCKRNSLPARRGKGRKGKETFFVDYDASLKQLERKGKKRVFHTIVQVSRKDLPMTTLTGVIWTVPLSRPKGSLSENLSCELGKCTYYEKCKEQVYLGNYIACESPLEKELLPKESSNEILVEKKGNPSV